MALQLATELESGITGNYWRITGCRIDIANDAGMVMIGLYIDKAARMAGKTPIMIKNYQYAKDDNPLTIVNLSAKDPVRAAYEKLLENPDFAGATNV